MQMFHDVRALKTLLKQANGDYTMNDGLQPNKTHAHTASHWHAARHLSHTLSLPPLSLSHKEERHAQRRLKSSLTLEQEKQYSRAFQTKIQRSQSPMSMASANTVSGYFQY